MVYEVNHIGLPARRVLAALDHLRDGKSWEEVRDLVPGYEKRTLKNIYGSVVRLSDQYGFDVSGVDLTPPEDKKAKQERMERLCADRARRDALASECYDRYESGESWNDLAYEHGFAGHDAMRKLVYRWASRVGKQWPIVRKYEEQAYFLYASSGKNMSWDKVGKALGGKDGRTCREAAERYAKREGLPSLRSHLRNRSEVYAYLCEHTREEACAHFGYESVRHMCGSISTYCTVMGLPIPWETKNRGVVIPGRSAEAYFLRREGMSWTEIAERLDYMDANSALSCAHKWGDRNNLPRV